MADQAQTIELPAPSQTMAFDGERFVSGVGGEIAHEHYLRYLFAMQFCHGKQVLDIASGEGYGSSLLGQVAASVKGVDLSREAVEFAGATYATPRVSFVEGDVRSIPLEDASFDVVVSFETVEHVTEHEQFLTEIKRVLRPGGLLVISSPNRDVYLKGLPPNPYHRRESTMAEFIGLLESRFAHLRIGQQRSLAGAILLPAEAGHPFTFKMFSQDGSSVTVASGSEAMTYLVAVVTDHEMPDIAWGVLADATFLSDIREAQADGVRRLQSDLEALKGERTVFVSEVARLTADRERLEADYAGAERSKAELQAAVTRYGQQLDDAKADIERLHTDRRTIGVENQALRAEIASLTGLLATKEDFLAQADMRAKEALASQRKQLLSDVLSMLA